MLFLNVDLNEQLHPAATGSQLLRAFLTPAPLQHLVPHLNTQTGGAAVRIDYDLATPCQSLTFVTYIVDWQWLDAVLPPEVEAFTVCANWVPETGDTEEPIARFREGSRDVKVGRRTVTVVHPVQDTGLMHAKLFVVDFGAFVRIVVGTCNLTLDDFVNMGQGFWCVDAPRRADTAATTVAPAGLDSFAGQLDSVLRVLSLQQCADRLTQYDLSFVAARLVLSLPKTHVAHLPPQEQYEYGYDGEDEEEEEEPLLAPEWNGRLGSDSLAEAVSWARGRLDASDLTELDSAGVPVVYQASSVGGISDDILMRMERACGPSAQLHALFPSTTTVRSQLQNRHYGAIALRCFQGSGGTLATSRWHDFPSTTKPFHTKMLYHVAPTSGNGWIYMGSHNFTSDSWCFTRKAAPPGVPVPPADPRNIELGILLPVRSAADGTEVTTQLQHLRDVLPAPFWLPPAATPVPFANAFVFLRDRAMIKAAGEADGTLLHFRHAVGPGLSMGHMAASSEDLYFASYHWRKFQAEYSNPFGRH